LRRASFWPIAILAIVFSGIVGVVLFRVAADQKPQRVDLKWNPPVPVPGATVASYNVYRGTQSGGPYDKIATGVTGLSYTDRDVSSGKIYYYVVRAVDVAGRESQPSNQASAEIH
jgi:fibronectin type 3 domain-containing protein